MIALLLGLAHAQPSVTVQAGFPWSEVTAAGPLTPRLSAVGTWRSARLTRHLPSAGVSALLVDRRWQLSGDALTGWMVQTGTLAASGPTAAMRLTLQRPGTFTPTLHFGGRGLLLLEQTITITEAGSTTDTAAAPALSVLAGVGLGWQVRPQARLFVGLDFDQIEVPGISIPGAHAGLTVTRAP